MRGRKACHLCTRKGRVPVGFCDQCHNSFCEKHGFWDGVRWLCSKCGRLGRQ